MNSTVASVETKLRRLQQVLLLPWTMENDERQPQAQSQSRSTSKSGISSGAFLVVLQINDEYALPTSDIERAQRSFSPLL